MQLELRGAVAELHRQAANEWPHLPLGSAPIEVLVEGPARTGKTTGLIALLFSLAVRYPKSRQLWCRDTRRSLTDSVLNTFHEDVLPDGHYLNERMPTDMTARYQLRNGSVIVLGGLDKPSRLYSTKWDAVYINELFELTLDDPWLRFLRGLSNGRFTDGTHEPFHLLIGDTNPADPYLWANQRFLPEECTLEIGGDGGMTKKDKGARQRIRVQSVHEDNPHFFNLDRTPNPRGASMIAGLDELGEGTVLWRQLRKGEWCAGEGVVWDTYDRRIHLVHRPRDEADKPIPLEEALGITWYFGSQDWGHTAPGVLQIWGVAPDGSPFPGAAKSGRVLFRVAEVYQTAKGLPWWADEMCLLHSEFGLRAIVCDHDPSAIEAYNDAVQSRPDRDGHLFARKADKTRKTHVGEGDLGGLDLVRQWFGQGRIFLLKDSLRGEGVDNRRKAVKLPYCTEMEIPSYVYKAVDPDRRNEEHTDPKCEDHGCDALRYAVKFAHTYDLSPPDRSPVYEKGKLADLLNWNAVRFDDM